LDSIFDLIQRSRCIPLLLRSFPRVISRENWPFQLVSVSTQVNDRNASFLSVFTSARPT